MNNNNEDHIWITTQRRRVRGLGATMLSISQMCKPYVLSEIKRKKEKKKERHERNLQLGKSSKQSVQIV